LWLTPAPPKPEPPKPDQNKSYEHEDGERLFENDEESEVEEEEEEEEGEDLIGAETFVSDDELSRVHLDVDGLSTEVAPHTLDLVFFARRRSGFMPAATTTDAGAFAHFMRFGQIKGDPVAQVHVRFFQITKT
jgi:hypothetical protein